MTVKLSSFIRRKFSSLIRRAAFLSALLVVLTVTVSCQQPAPPKAEQRAAASNTRGAVWKEISGKVDPSAKYLFYLHGLIVENEGVRPTSPRFGVYEYEQILETFASKGFIVISEPRPKGTIVTEYAGKVVGQINALVKAGVAPQHITVVGASRGGVIAVAVSSQLKNRNVNFVILASCGNSDLYRTFHPDLWGNVLSIYDFKDDTGAGTCQRFFDQSTGLNRHREIEVKLGLGHGLLYRPLKEWVDPIVEWANQT